MLLLHLRATLITLVNAMTTSEHHPHLILTLTKLENHSKGISDSLELQYRNSRWHNPNCSLRKRLSSKEAPSTHTANWKDSDTL